MHMSEDTTLGLQTNFLRKRKRKKKTIEENKLNNMISPPANWKRPILHTCINSQKTTNMKKKNKKCLGKMSLNCVMWLSCVAAAECKQGDMVLKAPMILSALLS